MNWFRMAAPRATRRQFRFGAFELDATGGELRKHGLPLKLRPQASKVLLLLVDRAGQLVSRDELRQALWGGDTHVEFDQALNACVRDVRGALSDKHSQPRYIATVPGGGYRFIAPVDSGTEVQQSETHLAPMFWKAAFVCLLIFALGLLWGFKRSESLTGGRSLQSTVRNPEAYTLYQLGRRFLDRYSVEGAEDAVETFQLASSKDPGFALPFAGLADAYCWLALKRRSSPAEQYPKALWAARRALDLDGSSAEAHLAMARVRMNYERNWAAAEYEHRRALAINPKLAEAHLSYGLQLMFQSRLEPAREETRRAQELNPQSARVNVQFCQIASAEHNFEEAARECRAAMERDRIHAGPRLMLAEVYTQQGRYLEAANLLSEFNDDSYARQSDVAGYLYAISGRRAEAMSTLNSLKQRYRPHQVARVYMGLGNKDEALEWLEKAYADHGAVANLTIDPVFAPLTPDPRFQSLLRRVGLAN